MIMPLAHGGAGRTRVKPRLRGVSHQYAFFASLVAGPALVLTAPTPHAALVVTIYACSLSMLLGASALYHRVTWSQRARFWMSRLDLAMIFLLIAGTYTPLAALILRPLGPAALWVVWLSALAGIVLKFLWPNPSKLATAVVYVCMSSMGAFIMPTLVREVGAVPVSLFVSGGLLYLAGAAIYAFQRPDPYPAVFGYHEIFHAFVIVAAATHYAAMYVYIVPRLA
jgi:hemolysin III